MIESKRERYIRLLKSNADLNFVELTFDAVKEIIELLEETEIVKCKDCKHIQKWRNEESAKKFGQIYECARSVLNCPKPEDFCSRAERKEEFMP